MGLDFVNQQNDHPSQAIKILTTLIKFALIIGINIFVFLPRFLLAKWILLFGEIVVLFVIKPDLKPIWGILKVLLINFIPTLFLFYFASFSWFEAILSFSEYALKIFILFIGVFIFYFTIFFEFCHI